MRVVIYRPIRSCDMRADHCGCSAVCSSSSCRKSSREIPQELGVPEAIFGINFPVYGITIMCGGLVSVKNKRENMAKEI